jgi:copper oxidase (laccase) domain-containing protein
LRLLDVLEPGPEALAILSPAISGEKYPVGPEVHQALAGLPGAAGAVREEGIDLRTVLREQLLRGGFESDRIALDVRCSASDGDLFSYRRDQGSTGRGGLLIGWKF